ncbi:MAG: flagellar brake protein [Betaproteobacteria bacterium]|nr:MAG: flagellar brake protein [Betaproteobacteria bacterium]
MTKKNQIDGVIELSPETENNKFRITSKSEILNILQIVMKRNMLTALHFDHNNDFILTSILAIDTELRQMVVDSGEIEKFSRVALHANKVTLVTSQDQSKIQFTCTAIKKIKFEKRNAFSIDLPESLLRIKKRQYYHITKSTPKLLKCIIPIPNEQNSDITGITGITVHDISCGGITLTERDSLVNLKCGTTYKNCRITLPGIGVLNIAIRVKNTYKVTLENGLNCKYAGCEFINLPQEMLEMIRQYISRLKQEEIKQAISENRFKVDPEAVADRLLETVRELMRSKNRETKLSE